MMKKASGVMTAAVCLFVAACGQDRSSTPSADTLKKQGQGVQSPGKNSCDLLPAALSSTEGWTSVRRGAEELMAMPVAFTPELVSSLKSMESSFDPSRNCAQILKGMKNGQAAFLEIVPEACGNRGVIGEERAGAFRLKIGELLAIQESPKSLEAPKGQQAPVQAQGKAPVVEAPKQQAPVQAQGKAPVIEAPKQQAPVQAQGKQPVEAPKVVETPKAKAPACNLSRYTLLHSEKKGERVVGSFEVRLRIEPAPVMQAPKQEQGKGKGTVIPQQQQQAAAGIHHYDFFLTSLCTESFRSACLVSLNNGLIEGIKFLSQAPVENLGEIQGQGKNPLPQTPVQGKVTPVQQQQPAPQKPVVEAPSQKPVQQPAPQKPVQAPAPQKPTSPTPQLPA